MINSATVAAPAKVNLTLHVTGRRTDGYHVLDSIVGFAAVYDHITLSPSESLTLSVSGPEAAHVPSTEDNLAVRAVRFLASELNVNDSVHLALEKHIPVSAGLGGGSADAAAALKAAQKLWGRQMDSPVIDPAMTVDLGADVPVCYFGRPARVTGIGDMVTLLPPWPETWLVLVNPRVPLPTAQVFTTFAGPMDPADKSLVVRGWSKSAADFVGVLNRGRNSLTDAAVSLVPQIGEVLAALESTSNCLLARMSGSGPTCFGLFAADPEAQAAADQIAAQAPEWWVQAAKLLSAADADDAGTV